MQMEEKYRRYVDTLTTHLKTCDDIMAQVRDATSEYLTVLSNSKGTQCWTCRTGLLQSSSQGLESNPLWRLDSKVSLQGPTVDLKTGHIESQTGFRP